MSASSCANCGQTTSTDSLGVIRTTQIDRVWHSVPAKFRARVRQATSIADLERIGRKTSNRVKVLRSTRPAALATLAEVHEGDRVLVLSSEHVAIAEAFSYLGASVTVADNVADRLRFAVLAMRRQIERAVLVDLEGRLPWADDTFDVVFVDLARLTDRGLGGAAKRALLRELRRIARPDATAVVTTRNPLSVALAQRDLSARLRGWPRLMRRLGVSGLWAPWNKAVDNTGWSVKQAYVVRPSIDHCVTLTPAAPAPKATDRKPRSPLDRVRQSPRLAHDMVLSLETHKGAGRQPLSESLVSAGASTISSNAMRAAFDAPTGFAKIPLSPDQEADIRSEVGMTRRAAETAFRPVTPSDVHESEWYGKPFGRFPHLQRAEIDPRLVETMVADALERIPAQTRQLRETELYQRTVDPLFPNNYAKGSLRRVAEIVGGLGDSAVPVGPAHGDLHWDNVIPTSAQTVYFVDWEGFMEEAPLFLDPLHAAVEFHATRSSQSIADGIRDFDRGLVDGPLARLAVARLGSLTLQEGLAVLVLHNTLWEETLSNAAKASARIVRKAHDRASRTE